jgi:thioredoxin-related protein
VKLLFALFIVSFLINGNVLANRLEQAEQKAQSEHKFILLNFSGSDWCAPCIRMDKEILESEDFKSYANTALIFINADFPRLKKHQLSPGAQKENDELAEKYNSDGVFPCTLLLDSNGKIIRTWKGYYTKGAMAFTEEVKELVGKKG